jgi:2'-5' RNA ligase
VTNRSILIYPKLNNIELIDTIRTKYDPIAQHIRPHITLVFPFVSNLTIADLETHIENAVKAISPFKLLIKGIRSIDDKHLILCIEDGKDSIIQLHNNLNKGILEQYYPEFLHHVAFLPHMTVGTFEEKSELQKALNELQSFDAVFETVINEICVEIIDENQDSIIELVIVLKGGN